MSSCNSSATAVALAQLRDLDDAQGEHLSRRVLVAVGRKTNPALLDGLPCVIEGLRQEFHLVSVEGAGERVSRCARSLPTEEVTEAAGYAAAR